YTTLFRSGRDSPIYAYGGFAIRVPMRSFTSAGPEWRTRGPGCRPFVRRSERRAGHCTECSDRAAPNDSHVAPWNIPLLEPAGGQLFINCHRGQLCVVL